MSRAHLAAAAVATALAAIAPAARAESPRSGSFELGFGPYRPNVDGTFNGATPYRDTFGSSRRYLFRLGVYKTLFDKFGALEVGLRSGYFRADGKGYSVVTTGTGGTTYVKSGDPTSFNIVPTSAVLAYRFDWFAERFSIPLAPYGRVAFERYNWWVTNGKGNWSKYGATNGWSATGGLALQLDFFDPALAREMDADTGVNHTYVFFDVTKAVVDDFGRSRSFDLSSNGLTGVTWATGLMFVF